MAGPSHGWEKGLVTALHIGFGVRQSELLLLEERSDGAQYFNVINDPRMAGPSHGWEKGLVTALHIGFGVRQSELPLWEERSDGTQYFNVINDPRMAGSSHGWGKGFVTALHIGLECGNLNCRFGRSGATEKLEKGVTHFPSRFVGLERSQTLQLHLYQ